MDVTKSLRNRRPEVLSLLLLLTAIGCGGVTSSDSAGPVAPASRPAATGEQASEQTGGQRLHDVELVHVASDGAETRMAIDHPLVAEISMTAETLSGDTLRCRLKFLGSGSVDRYEFAYSAVEGTWWGKTATFAGQEKIILDNEHGTFLLRAPK